MPNVALNKYADASNAIFPYQPAKSVDGVLTPLNRWVGSSPLPPEPATPPPVWLRIDLGSTFWVNRWVVKQMGAVGWSPNYNLTDYKLQGSLDNANWFDLDSVTNNSANQTDRPFTPRNIRWARVYVTKGLRCNTNFASIVDLELYDAANAPYLTALTTNPGTLNPAFSSKTNSYSVSVDSTVSSISLTPTANTGSTIKVKVGGNQITGGPSYSIPLPNPGTYNVTVEVTSNDNLMTNIYTITVTRTGNTAYLMSMVLKNNRGGEITLNPSFTNSNLEYGASIASGVPSVSVTPTAVDPTNSTIRVNGSIVASGAQSNQITMNMGTNLITIQVDNTNGGQSIYHITVTKS